MQMSNIRPNFTYMSEEAKRQFFFFYCEKRNLDFSTATTKVVKLKKCSSKEPKLNVTKEQMELLKLLNLI